MFTKALFVAAIAATTASAQTYKASFTEYGSGDQNNSGNCNVLTNACGYYTSPGYAAAASQNIFGVGPGQGAGPGCGTCWQLTAQTDSSGNKLSGVQSIVVKVTNLCPGKSQRDSKSVLTTDMDQTAQGNPLCAQSSTSATNQYGANVNFDTCIDSGASKALFGSSGVGLAIGTATKVNCSQWKGTVIS